MRGVGSKIFLFIFGIVFRVGFVGGFRSWFNVGVCGFFCINGFLDLGFGWLDKKGFFIGLGFWISESRLIRFEKLLFKILGFVFCGFWILNGVEVGSWVVNLFVNLVWFNVSKF